MTEVASDPYEGLCDQDVFDTPHPVSMTMLARLSQSVLEAEEAAQHMAREGRHDLVRMYEDNAHRYRQMIENLRRPPRIINVDFNLFDVSIVKNPL